MDLGAARTWRYVRAVAPVVAAGAQQGATNLATFDDARDRRLTGIFVSGGGTLQHTQLNVAGRVIADVDHVAFAAARGPLELDQLYPAGTLFSINSLVDAGGVAIAANTVVVTLRYSVDQGVQAPAPSQ